MGALKILIEKRCVCRALRGECHQCSLPQGHSGTPEGWTPHRNERRLLPPPARGISGVSETKKRAN